MYIQQAVESDFDPSELDRLVLEALYELQFHGTLTRDESHISGYRILSHPKGVPVPFVELWLAHSNSYVPGCERFWMRGMPEWAKEIRGCEGWDLPIKYEAAMRNDGHYNSERQLSLEGRIDRLQGLGYVKRFSRQDWPFPDPLEIVRYDGKTIRVLPFKNQPVLRFRIAANIGDIDPKTRDYVTISLLVHESKGLGFDFVRLQRQGIRTVIVHQRRAEAAGEQLRQLILESNSQPVENPVNESVTSINLWNSLGDRQRNCLQALLELRAFDADSRRSASEIAKKVEGRDANDNGFKEPLAHLVHLGFARRKRGRRGGYWISKGGCNLVPKVDSCATIDR